MTATRTLHSLAAILAAGFVPLIATETGLATDGDERRSRRPALGATATLYDNGEPNLINRYSNNVPRDGLPVYRGLLDDFVVPDGETWILRQLQWHHTSNDKNDGPYGIDAVVKLRIDAQGTPGPAFKDLNVTSYSEMPTGRIAFSGEEMESWVEFDPVLLPPGKYWFESALRHVNGDSRWFTADLRNRECWVNYEDLGGLQSGTDQFGVASDLAWSLAGVRETGPPDACCFADGTCAALSFLECEAQGGIFQGDGVECGLEVCGVPGVCCVIDGTCVNETDLFCDAAGGVFGGAGETCATFECPPGECTFVFEAWYRTGIRPSDLAVGDFDGDERPDVALAKWGSDAASVLLNNGDGSFGPAMLHEDIEIGFGVATGDLDGDLDLDLAFTTLLTDELQILLNDGTGVFTEQIDFDVRHDPFHIALADVDGDQDLDAVLAHFGSSEITVQLNDGTGCFSAGAVIDLPAIVAEVALGDIDGDLDPDLVVTQPSVDHVHVMLNDGTGNFSDITVYQVLPGPDSVRLEDVNGDTHLDLLVAAREVSVLLNDGNGGFTSRMDYHVGLNPRSLAVADADGDSFPEIAVVNYDDADVSFLVNNGDGTFGSETRVASGELLVDVALVDADGDGEIELLIVDREFNQLRVLPYICPPCVADLDGSGAVDFGDILAILSAWGMNGVPEDLDGSGTVDFGDLLVILGGWGPCP